MTEYYVQTLDVETSAKDKAKLIGGALLMLFSLAFLIVAVLVNYWFFIGFGAFIVSGMILVQIYESLAAKFCYSTSEKRIVVSKKNNAGNGKRLASVEFASIKRIERFCDIVSKDDIVACDNTGDQDVYALVYQADGVNKRILFKPDDYLIALLKEIMPEKFEQETEI